MTRRHGAGGRSHGNGGVKIEPSIRAPEYPLANAPGGLPGPPDTEA